MFPASIGEISRQCTGLVESSVHDNKQKEDDLMTENVMRETAYDSIEDGDELGQKNKGGQNHSEVTMRRKLKFYFMNPMQKWKYGGKFPFKLLLQVLKIIFVTLQLGLFASFRYEDVDFHWNAKTVLSNLFIEGWESDREVNEYPPAQGPLAVYTQDEFDSAVSFILIQYKSLASISMGLYAYDEANNLFISPEICITSFKESKMFSFNESYYFDDERIKNCFVVNSNELNNFSLSSFLSNRSAYLDFQSFVMLEVKFTLRSINVATTEAGLGAPDCYKFKCNFQFKDLEKTGQVLIGFTLDHVRFRCRGSTNYVEHANLKSMGSFLLSIMVICLCTLSFLLCSRAVYRGYALQREVSEFFYKNFSRPLELHDRLEFVNLWYVMILVNDVMIVTGSLMKEQLKFNLLEDDSRNVCAALLGTGNLLVWLGVLRYFGFFRKYNVLILTLKRAMPNVLRFLLVVLLVYAGFVFCGWVVLGPYHFKFRTLYTTSECLFSVINGDDMFATFSSMTGKSSFLWWYSRIYLYIFISLFIYVVLSLFIAVIMDAYETIKLYYKEGFPASELFQFINSGADPHPSYLGLQGRSGRGCLSSLCCCCPPAASAEETRPLLT